MNEPKLFRNGRVLLVILTLLSVGLCVYFLPSGHTKQYDFAVGQPWTYSELISDFSFSVEKSPEVYQHEIDSLQNAAIPYFDRNTAVGTDALERFDKLMEDTLSQLVGHASGIILRQRLKDIYNAGIIEVQDAEMYMKGKSTIRICQGNQSEPAQAQGVYDVKSAYQYLTAAPLPVQDRYELMKFTPEDYLSVSLTYNKEKSEEEIKEQTEQVSRFKGMVMADQKIIGHGEIVTPESYQTIRSYLNNKSESKESSRFRAYTIGGHTLLVALLYLILAVYMSIYRSDYLREKRKLLFFYIMLVFFTVATCLFVQYTEWSVFVFPATMLALILRVFLESRTAFYGHVVYVLTCSLMVSMPYEFTVLQLLAGLVAIFSMRELTQRSQIFKTALLVLLTYSVVWLAYQLVVLEDLRNMTWILFVYFVTNSVLLLITYPLLFALEKIFGFTSNVTLVELSNLNNPLLRQLSEMAPGTFQHSMQVSTLAAEGVKSIGGNVQLARTGALYHDIGKLANPAYFTENQNSVNPHDSLTEAESAAVITGHVTEGLKLAEKYHLPVAVKEFISSHHGRGTARYFFIKYCNAHPGEKVDAELFSYPGPNPLTKEQAVLMMADSTEAASRSLKEYTEESIGKLVDDIVGVQISEGYFNNCDISYKQIETVKEVFKERLRTMYHTRVTYPKLQAPPATAAPSDAAADTTDTAPATDAPADTATPTEADADSAAEKR